MKEIINMNMIECPKCGEISKVKKCGILASIGIGGGLIATLTGSVITYFITFSFLTLGFFGLHFFIGIGLFTFLLFFLPVYSLIRYFAGYTIECKGCGAKYKMSTKEFCEIKNQKDPLSKVAMTVFICVIMIIMVIF